MSAIRGVRGSVGVTGVVLVLVLALIVPGCAPKPAADSPGETAATDDAAPTPVPAPATVTATVETARQAGQLAAAIEKEPARTAELLAGQGWTAEAYEALLFEIAADPALAEAYEAARKGS